MFFNKLLLGLTSFRSPLLQGIVPCVAAAFGCQIAAGIPSILFGTERFFDFSGSVTFLAVGALSLYLPALRSRAAAAVNGVAPDKLPALPSLTQMISSVGRLGAEQGAGARDWRQVAATALVLIWATRLGSYLLSRITDHGTDSRFDKIRHRPARFSFTFFMQALWVSFQMMPVLALNAVPSATLAASKVSPTTAIGLGLWAAGFVFEVGADMQKSRWLREKRDKVHDQEFLTGGFFNLCRYPNYFGEITMWTGLATTAAGILAQRPVQFALGLSGGVPGIVLTSAISFISPAFISLLLLKVSGIPLSEPKYDKKFGHRKDYQEWRNNTPRLIPKFW